MNDDQFSKMMTLLVAIYNELHELNNPPSIDLSSLEELGLEIYEVPDGGADD
jgi:hypothetical protein